MTDQQFPIPTEPEDYAVYLKTAARWMQWQIDPHNSRAITGVFVRLRKVFQPLVIGKCVEDFIQINMDVSKPGEEGMAAGIPRIGGHYRQQVRQLPWEEKDELAALVRDVILAGYIMCAGTFDNLEETGYFLNDPLPLFFAWVWAINQDAGLASIIYKLDREANGIASVYTRGPRLRLEEFMNAHGMKESLVGRTRDRIICGYASSGVVLRLQQLNEKAPELGKKIMRMGGISGESQHWQSSGT